MTLPRVLLVSHTYTAWVNRAKLDALAEHAILTAIIPNRWQETFFTLSANKTESSNYTLHALPIRFNGHILRYLYPFRDLYRIIAQTQPDLIYVEEEPASLALTQVAFLRRQSYLICFTWENIFRRVGIPMVERFNLSRCDAAIAGNAQAADVLRAKKFDRAITIIPQLGVDPAYFQPGKSDELRQALGLDSFVIGFIGRFVAGKGLWTLLAAVADSPGIQLLVVGSGPLQCDMERWIAARNLTQRVRIMPVVPHEEIPRYLRALEILVLPSETTPTWKEQFGHVLIEAMACGVPVIGSDSGAIPEVLGDGGLIFPERDANALRAAIVDLKSNPARRAELARAGRARVLAKFTHEHIAAQNAHFFRRVLAG